MQDRYFPLISASLFFLVFIIGILLNENSLFYKSLIFIGFIGFLLLIGYYYFFERKNPKTRRGSSKTRKTVETKQKGPKRKISDKCEMDGCPNIGYYYPCSYCGKYFCENHRLPPQHNCVNIQQWKEKPVPTIGIIYTQEGAIFTNESNNLKR